MKSRYDLRNAIEVYVGDNKYFAFLKDEIVVQQVRHRAPCHEQVHRVYFGPTPLIAAMRCYVASKLGDEVEVPEELK